MKSSYAHISKKNYDPRARARTGCARTLCFENDKKVLESPETSTKLKKKISKMFYPYNRKNLEKFCENFFPKIFPSFFSVITENFFFNFLDVSGDSKTIYFFWEHVVRARRGARARYGIPIFFRDMRVGGFHESVQKVSGRYLRGPEKHKAETFVHGAWSSGPPLCYYTSFRAGTSHVLVYWSQV